MGKEAAVMKGFKLIGPKFYDLFREVRKNAKGKELALYCWRGGMRSNIVAWMMALADYDVSLIQGGYKSYRQYAHGLFAQNFHWIILSGKTGSGKTELLHQLAACGEQVLDLEALAHHKGSAFGHLGELEQPTVEQFENKIAWQLRQFDMNKPVWVESESRTIGKARIPDAIFNQMIAMPLIEIERTEEARRKLILDEYGIYPITALIEATEKLERRLGGDRMKIACQALLSEDWQGWLDILIPYYDKTYAHSRNARIGASHPLTLSGNTDEDVKSLIVASKKIWNQ
jgi:tRNA 2-selenouridine synthase